MSEHKIMGIGHEGWWDVTVRDAGTEDHGEYGVIGGVFIDVEAAFGWTMKNMQMSTSCAEAMRKALNSWKAHQSTSRFPDMENLFQPFHGLEPRYHILAPNGEKIGEMAYYIRDRLTSLRIAIAENREQAIRIADALNVTQGHPPLYQESEPA